MEIIKILVKTDDGYDLKYLFIYPYTYFGFAESHINSVVKR